MFLGQYYHNIDDKGRLTIPVRYRDVLVSEGAYMVLGFDPIINVLLTSTYMNWTQQLKAMTVTDPEARVLRRLMYSTANQVEVDKAGRILIPQFLRQAAGLQNNAMAVIVGTGEYFEIWSPDNWAPQVETLQDTAANSQRFANRMITST